MINLSTQDWSISDIDTILFDKDGTFVDLHYFWGRMTELRALEVIKYFQLPKVNFESLCLNLGYDVKTGKMLSDGITALYSRPKIIEIFKADLLNLGVNTTDEILAKIFDDVSSKFYDNMHSYTKPIPEAIEFIKKVRLKGVNLGVVTSDSVVCANLTIKNNSWDELFDVVVGRESSPYSKESGEPVKLALKQLCANPNNTIMIGDAPMDYICAKNAGLKASVLVATGQMKVDELVKTGDFVVGSLDEISVS